MPVTNINRYACPIHPDEVEYGYDTPPGWFYVNSEVYCPLVAHEAADYLVENPSATMVDALASLAA